MKAISFTKAEAIQTLRVGLQPLFGESSSGGAFQVGFKVDRFFAVGEGDGCFYAPGGEFGGVTAVSGIMFLQTGCKVFRESNIIAVLIFWGLQNVDVIEFHDF